MGKVSRFTFYVFFILFLSAGYAYSAVTHKVKSGDTLGGISKKYKVSVDKLRSLNGLTSNKLRLGQKLVVENSGSGPSAKQKEKICGVQWGEEDAKK